MSSTMPDSEPLVAAPEASDEPPAAIRKVERTQNFESRAFSVSSLERLLNSRKTSGTGAKYWKLLSIKRISVTEHEGDVPICFERLVLECNECGYKHGGKSIAPANFAKSHFDQHTTPHVRCRRAKNNGTSKINRAFVAKHYSAIGSYTSQALLV
jgi:hypothetical protein